MTCLFKVSVQILNNLGLLKIPGLPGKTKRRQMMRKVSTWLFILVCLGGLLVLTTGVRASGFALLEQSGKGLGEAFAGGVTDTDDPSSLFYNPAAMAFMPTARGALIASVIDVSAKFKDEGSTTSPVFGGAPLTGGDGGEGGTTGYVPCLYYVQPIVENVNFGLAVNVPFGLVTDYDDGWKGRYHGLKSDLAVININPNVAVQVLPDLLSLGVGLNVQYADAELTNAIDFGAVNYASGMPLGPGVAPPDRRRSCQADRRRLGGRL